MLTSIRRPFLYLTAVLLCLAASLYSFVWMYDARRMAHPVELGFNLGRDTNFDDETQSIPVFDVAPDSPAARAGLRPGDEIVGLEGAPLTSYGQFDRIWSIASPGDHVKFEVRRAGQAHPVSLEGVFRSTRLTLPAEGFARAAARQIKALFPVLFLIVGFAVLFSRIEDPYTWLLALFFTCMIATPSFNNLGTFPEGVQRLAQIFRAIFNGMVTPMVYLFFAVFPEKSPLERRAPWLKWVAILFGISQVLPGLASGNAHWPEWLNGRFGPWNVQYTRETIGYTFVGLGFVSLFLTSRNRSGSVEARRKAQVLLWGTLLGILPVVLERFAVDFWKARVPFWLDTLVILSVCVYPLSFAYAVVRYRVLEIPALLRRSARYVLVQRGYVTLLLCGALLAIFLFARFFSGFFAQHSEFAMASSAIFGVGLVWVSGPLVRRGTQRIDRAFFRSSYDARLILQDLAEQTRNVTHREALAALLSQHLTQALHPNSLAFFFTDAHGVLRQTGSSSPMGDSPAVAAFLENVRERGRAWDVPPSNAPEYPAEFPLAPLAPECAVPLLGRNSRLVGLIVLGQSLSEEPYSREDKRLLESVAGQSAVALENISLAETIADRLDLERRAAHELEIARDVQARLFPQVMPPLTTLEYAGDCVQARQVGGDYYDFLDLGSSRVAFVLADISGKGIAGALLMASLQASLRSRYATAFDELASVMKSVNHLFFENSPDDRYATMFIGVYDDTSRTMEYANCGHNPPLLFRGNGALERLVATASVVGLFDEWECATQRIALAPGDLLIIYTDGVTEANDAGSNEFTESRLEQTVRSNSTLLPSQLLTRVQEAVQAFSNNNPSDDLTLVIARAR